MNRIIDGLVEVRGVGWIYGIRYMSYTRTVLGVRYTRWNEVVRNGHDDARGGCQMGIVSSRTHSAKFPTFQEFQTTHEKICRTQIQFATNVAVHFPSSRMTYVLLIKKLYFVLITGVRETSAHLG